MLDAESQLRLVASVAGLADRAPDMSARHLVQRHQRVGLIVLALLLVVGVVLSAIDTAIVVFGFFVLVYVAGTIYRIVLFARSVNPSGQISISDAEARSARADDLPVYTVLVPLYHEAAVIGQLIEHVDNLDYPRHLLDIKLLVEEDDGETLDAVLDSTAGDHFELVIVPAAEPRTKPKALNFGLTLARGELVTIYDAEDQPEPLQLRRAAVALARLGPDVACLQAKLGYHNPEQNLITMWFTIEYAMWFSLFLPGLTSVGAPLPLGGTSNHFRRSALVALGGWDPFNVTEDADLGIRLFREGMSVRVLDSYTYEEANSDFVNWVKQRSRWYKGYLQTFLIHMRHPLELAHEIGWWPTVQFCLFVGGTPVLAVLNPLFWGLTAIWFIGHPAFIKAAFPAPTYYLGLICWAFGNFLIAYLTVVTCRLTRRPRLLWAALLVPFYWVMMAIAGLKALWQLVAAPNYWEKTTHGLHLTPTADRGAA
jgi:cellulose synthase/poly-beta-1,6-N-acetylglucosamine synthase-like glycosyltransferase